MQRTSRHVLILVAFLLLSWTHEAAHGLESGTGGEGVDDDNYEDDDNYDDDDDNISGPTSVQKTTTARPAANPSKKHKVHTESPDKAAEVVSPEKQEIGDVCSHWSLQQAASYAASRYCEHLGRHHKQQYKIECSTIQFEVIRADVRVAMVAPPETTAQHYESTVALKNPEGQCVGAFNSTIHVSQGDPPELKEVHTLPCSKIQMTGGCNSAKAKSADTTSENSQLRTTPTETSGKTTVEIKTTSVPSGRPTKSPTKSSSASPTESPTNVPSSSPTLKATKPPTKGPSVWPSFSTSRSQTIWPFTSPTYTPTGAPVNATSTAAPSKTQSAKGVWLAGGNDDNNTEKGADTAKGIWVAGSAEKTATEEKPIAKNGVSIAVAGNEPAGVSSTNNETAGNEESESEEDDETDGNEANEESSENSAAICSRYGESFARGRVYVCGSDAYVCSDDKAWRKKFALVAADSTKMNCNLNSIAETYSSRKLCGKFPEDESELHLTGDNEGSPLACPKGGNLKRFYQFCAEENNNYYCDGKDCEPCAGTSRQRKLFLRH